MNLVGYIDENRNDFVSEKEVKGTSFWIEHGEPG